MSLEDNKALVRTLFDLADSPELETIGELLHPDFVNHSTGRPVSVWDAWKPLVEGTRRTLPDYKRSVHDMIAEDDKVVVRLTVEGTYQARSEHPEFGGIDATGQHVSWEFHHIFRVKDHKIVEH